jgi:hypothetical protein
MRKVIPVVLAIAAGISVATQQMLNANLRRALDSAAWSGFVSYFIGTVCSSAAVAGAVSRTLGAGGLLPTYFSYAAIQSEAISRWAVLRSNWPAHTSLWSFLSSASFTYEFQGEVLVDWGQKLRMELDPLNDSGIK